MLQEQELGVTRYFVLMMQARQIEETWAGK